MRRLIINADDLGFNRPVTDGIIECHLKGSITSATLMPQMPAAAYAAACVKGLERLSVGVHLSLCGGSPLAPGNEVPHLTTPDGAFPGSAELAARARRHQLPVREVEKEFRAQIRACLDMGVVPTHLDSHQNITVYPQVFMAMIRAAGAFGIRRLRTYRGWYHAPRDSAFRIRDIATAWRLNMVRAPKHLYYEAMHAFCRMKGFRLPGRKFGFYKLTSASPLGYTLSDFRRLARSLPAGSSELVAHPGLPSEDPNDRPAYRERRVVEYALFRSPESRQICREEGIELVSFREMD